MRVRYSLLCCDADKEIITIDRIVEKGSPRMKRSQKTGQALYIEFRAERQFGTDLRIRDPGAFCDRLTNYRPLPAQRFFVYEEGSDSSDEKKVS